MAKAAGIDAMILTGRESNCVAKGRLSWAFS